MSGVLVNYDGEYWPEDEYDFDECCPECHGEGWVEVWVDDVTRDEEFCRLCRGTGQWHHPDSETTPAGPEVVR